jgi:HD-GYP domain-containing protein (c-di-GMP phosphodiesterase class II)
MTTDRAYRKAMSKEEAIGELLVNSGTQFDTRVVQALVRLETR